MLEALATDGVTQQIPNAFLKTVGLVYDDERLLIENGVCKFPSLGVKEVVVVADDDIRLLEEDAHHAMGAGPALGGLGEKLLASEHPVGAGVEPQG